jgi:hypothetical protein
MSASEADKFVGFPTTWHYDQDDEEQVDADCAGCDSVIKFLKDKLEKRNGTQKGSTKDRR